MSCLTGSMEHVSRAPADRRRLSAAPEFVGAVCRDVWVEGQEGVSRERRWERCWEQDWQGIKTGLMGTGIGAKGLPFSSLFMVPRGWN